MQDELIYNPIFNKVCAVFYFQNLTYVLPYCVTNVCIVLTHRISPTTQTGINDLLLNMQVTSYAPNVYNICIPLYTPMGSITNVKCAINDNASTVIQVRTAL